MMFVADGQPVLIREEGKAWTRGDGYLECGGVGNILWAGQALGAGDFTIRASLTILNLARSAASFVIDGKSHFGFEGATGEVFLSGPLFGGPTKFLGDPSEFVRDGEPFRFEVVKQGTNVTFLIDGREVHTTTDARPRCGTFGFRPWRSTMRIREFSAEGKMIDLPAPRSQPTTYTIPTIDLSQETERQVVVESTPGQYLGHPTTVLLDDGKTMLCVYPLGHGGPAAVLKRSEDGGLTWSERLPVPDNWATATNCPCIHRLIGPDGVERLFVFEGNGDMRQSVSLDEGRTWTPFEPNGLHCVVAPITIVPISGGRHLAMYHRRLPSEWPDVTVWQSISEDGGLTWGPERKIAGREWADLCEPAVVRSPDGKQLAAFMRENSRRYNSFLITSNDEGETWSEPVELPASLTGDRHLARYAPDGRLVIPFRDVALDSPTRGDFVAWVGTYDDMVNLREGQFRVLLLESPVKGDLGYPGLEVLPDGTLAATTYAVLKPGEKHSVVSVRFRMEDIDRRAAMLPVQDDVFVSGTEGYHTFRIPSVIVTPKGTILAFCEGRKNSASDTGDIDLVLRRSTDGGETWGPLQIVAEDGPNTMGNPCPVVDRDTGTIWLLMTHNLGEDREPEIIAQTSKGTRTVWVTKSADDGETWSEPVEITAATKKPNWTWYATGPGVGIQLASGRMVIPCDHIVAETKEFGSHVIYSDDRGETWRLGGAVGPGVNECQVVELADGSLLLNMRNYHERESNRRALARSTDGGETWSGLSYDEALIEPICQASFLRYTTEELQDRNRLLFSNPASTSREKMTVRVSYDEGGTWPVAYVLHFGPAAYSCLTVLPDMTIGCLYERGDEHAYEKITFARLGLATLTDGEDRLPDE